MIYAISFIIAIVVLVAGFIPMFASVNNEEPITKGNYVFAGFMTTAAAVIVVLGLWGGPTYTVYEQGKAGEAAFAKAEQDRKIKIEEAKAYEQAASSYARAEVIRANGVKEANAIISDGLGGPEGYLRYLYITSLAEAESNGSTIIYVPTEAMIPIMEAGRTIQE